MSDREEIPVAGNGLLDRRIFLKTGIAGGAALLTAKAHAQERPTWMNIPGAGMSESGAPAKYETQLKRGPIGSQQGTTGAGASRSPLEHLDGIITPSRLHFERHHSGIPDINPDQHKLIIHGLVDRPLSFSVDSLARYPTVSNYPVSGMLGQQRRIVARRTDSGAVLAVAWPGVRERVGWHSLVSFAAGNRDQTERRNGSSPQAPMPPKWRAACRLDKVMDDAIVALYQNGEPLRPAQGFPMRLFLPGWEGNASVKWLHTIKVLDQPAMDEGRNVQVFRFAGQWRHETFYLPIGREVRHYQPVARAESP